MRPLEIILLILTTLMIFRLWLPAKPDKRGWRHYMMAWWVIAGTAAVVFGLHAWFESTRWQMYPTYGLLALGAVAILWGTMRPMPIRPRSVRILGWIGVGVLSLVAVALMSLPFLFPVPTLLEPTGPYAVGTVSLPMTDLARDEIFTDELGDRREYMVQFWYPAIAEPDRPRAPFMPQAELVTRTLADRFGFPSFLFGHVELMFGHAAEDLPAVETDENFPVLVFSPGYNSVRGQSTNLMEELASHGYIVASLGHAHGGVVTIFPEGRIVLLHDDALVGEGMTLTHSAIRLGNIWEADIRHLLDQLPAMQDGRTPVPFAGQMDLDTIGFMGHSTGSGVVARVCASDPRCAAGVGMDAWMGPVPDYMLNRGTDQPFLFFMSDIWPKPYNVGRINRYMTNSPQAEWITIEDSAHFDFADIKLLTPLSGMIGLSGPIDSYRSQEIALAYVVAYFDSKLKLQGDPLPVPNAEFPEVILQPAAFTDLYE